MRTLPCVAAAWVISGCGTDGMPSRPADSASSTDGGATLSATTSGPNGSSTGAADTSATGGGASTSGGDAPGLFEAGLIVPPNSLPCIPVSTGRPQSECNHHGSTVAQLDDGTIAAVWYHGEFEKSLDSRIVWSTLAPGATEWTAPEVLFDDPARAEGNPAVWVSETGEILVFFVSIYGKGWAETKVRLVRSDDNGASFSEPVVLRDADCWNTRQKPLRLANGDLMLPLYLECLGLPVFMFSSDDFQADVRWTEFSDLPDSRGYFADHLGQIQPTIAHRDDGTISALTRNGLGSGYILEMTSDAAGSAWTVSENIALPNSGTSIDQVRLANGHRIVIFNNDPQQRFPLAAALSVDDGKTFSSIRHLDDACDAGRGQCQYPYPSIVQAQDGTLWVTYTYNRQTIGWVHFDEAWLAQGGDEVNLP